MSLMLKARWKATCHLWHNLNFARGHRIIRLYRWAGLDTLCVWCSCGKVFGDKRDAITRHLSAWPKNPPG